MTEQEKKQVQEAQAAGRKVVCLDRSNRPPNPKRTPVPRDKDGLSRGSRRKLNASRRKRVKKEARELGYVLFQECGAFTQKRVRDLEAIMRDANHRQDNAAVRQFYRALVDGIIDAVKAEPPKEIKRPKAKRARRKKGA